MRKYLLILVIFLVSFFLIVGFSLNNYKIRYWAENNLPDKVRAIIKIIIKDKFYTLRFYNDYNTKFLPNTQFKSLSFYTKELKFIKRAKLNYLQELKKDSAGFFSFFIEIINGEIFITDTYGNFNLIRNFNVTDKIREKNVLQIDSNIKPYKVLDTYVVDDNKLFVSYVNFDNECKTFNISFAELNLEYLKFKDFFKGKECGQKIQGGRMQKYTHENDKGLIFSTANNIPNNPGNSSQDDSSFFGKIIFKSFDLSDAIIFSKGHRNPQGLLVLDKLILSTEHGPRGGDEINKILFNKNYGWPISSYGNMYWNEENQLKYKLSHMDHGFEEPIYAFIPSIGISEIIKLPNDYVKSWHENFIVTSLYKRSMYRIKFDNQFQRLIYKEEIYIGQRIRDVKYFKKNKFILLALENKGDLGIIINE